MGEPSRQPAARFRDPGPAFSAIAAAPLSEMVAAASDVALVVDATGVIRDVSFGDEDLARRLGPAWIDQPLASTVTVESRGKVQLMLGSAPDSGLNWQEINHATEGDDLPIRYAAMRPKGGSHLVALGRDLRAIARLQQELVDNNMSLERDYALYRSAETQFRLLFQTSGEAMLIADAATRKISDVNAAAEDLLHRVGRSLVGTGLDDVFSEANADAVGECLATVRALGQASSPAVQLRLTRAEVTLSAWLLRGGGTAQLLLRLFPGGTAAPKPSPLGEAWASLRHLPEAMVTTDGDLDIVEANEAFLDLVDAATLNQVRGEALARYVGRHGIDVNVLTSRLQDNGAIRRYATVLRGQFGAVRDVELTAAVVERDEKRAYAFLFRPVVAERPNAAESKKPLRPVSEMTDLVGRVPLRDIVREATDIIEELCIEAALDVTQDNRASAAEMLGLSRQSLYSKLRRYGLGDLPTEPSNGG